MNTIADFIMCTTLVLLLVLLLLLSGEVGLVGDVGGESDGQHLKMVGLFEPRGHRRRVLLRRHDGFR